LSLQTHRDRAGIERLQEGPLSVDLPAVDRNRRDFNAVHGIVTPAERWEGHG
jgi:hypothetical protein